MLRFIDLRFQGTQHRFAFWDTVTDRLRGYGQSVAWTTFSELEDEFGGLPYKADPRVVERLLNLCPSWVFEPATEDELDFRDEPDAQDPIL